MTELRRTPFTPLRPKPWLERIARPSFMLTPAVQHRILAWLATAGYALIVAGVTLIVTQYSPFRSPQAFAVIFLLLALGFSLLRERLHSHLDNLFFRGERVYQKRLQTLRAAFDTDQVNLPAVVKSIRECVENSLRPARMSIFLYDPKIDQYCAIADADEQPASDLRFSADSALVKYLIEQSGAVVFPRLQQLPAVLFADEARIRLLEARVYIPLIGQQRLTGWLALGQRLSGETYSPRDLAFLESMAEQAAAAIERAQTAARMENRAREMVVFSRLAQGINITRSFDDILELIYAQTGQVIPLQDFDLLLFTAENAALVPVFSVEDDERISSRENIPLPPGPLLEQEIIRARKPLMTDDYFRECQKHGAQPLKKDVQAWMGVPLNAGAETIGVLSIASRDPSIRFAPEQLLTLQSIADQTAGAIVKARLLNEAERRARQLASLNEVTRQLTSTLSLEPLLQTILNSAVDILNCEAGSLLMVSAADDDLVFEVVVGPVAEDLLKTRLPAGSGLAGKAVKERRSIFVNNVQQSMEWSNKFDQQTGFITHSLLVTPLEIKDNVIGVIEVINRKDGLPFSRDDEALLSAFAAQASVAIENARLYTKTDEALEARVEELSIMQTIDRELNASLETSRAVGITLQWAMRQSGAQAGLIAMVQENDLRVVAFEGYSDELSGYANGLLPVDRLNLAAVLQTGAPCFTLLEGDGGLLYGARSQTILAIWQEEQVSGILLLESTGVEPIHPEKMDFLVRLIDHASSAISNAQLYAAVQSANLAKSEFVSFVSHELKNPMTSVKGFTELLASGVVGPINEAQGNFLATIRSNIDRMNTLVSDLNDMSKIEAGRLRLDYKAFALAEVVEEVIRSTKRQIEEKEQTLTVHSLTDLPNLWADRTRIVQVLVNLVSNANKYTDKNRQIWLGAEHCENHWDAQGARQVVHVWVQDNGIGISEADQVKIFQKFFRSDDPKTREATGTGLGLNITRSLVEMQGGRIWFESTFREGTTFHFTVPIAE